MHKRSGQPYVCFVDLIMVTKLLDIFTPMRRDTQNNHIKHNETVPIPFRFFFHTATHFLSLLSFLVDDHSCPVQRNDSQLQYYLSHVRTTTVSENRFGNDWHNDAVWYIEATQLVQHVRTIKMLLNKMKRNNWSNYKCRALIFNESREHSNWILE